MFGIGIRTPAKKSDPTSQSPTSATEEQAQNSQVRRSIGEWESGQKAPLKRTPPKTRETAAAPPKPKPKSLSQDSKAPRDPVVTSPKTAPTYTNRVGEAKACHNKAKLHLANSRNLKTDIKLEVTSAVERLYMIVKEAEEELAQLRKGKGNNNQDQESGKRVITEQMVSEKREQHEAIMSQIKENTRLLEENTRKVEELKDMVQRQSDTIGRETYAGVVAAGQTRQPDLERTGLHSVVVSSTNEEETGEEVLERIRRVVDAKEGWIRVERVRKAKDRKIIMGCKTQEERRKIKEKIEAAGNHLVVEEMKNKDPLLVLRDVLKVHSDEDILGALRNQNPEVFHGLDDEENRVTVRYRRRARNPHNNNIVLSVSPIIWKRSTETGTLRVDLQRVRVEDQSPLVQCTRCLGYGHGRRLCTEPADLCSHCGGPHLRKDCPDVMTGETPVCKNCVRAKLVKLDHNAFSGECPIRKKWDDLARASVAYC